MMGRPKILWLATLILLALAASILLRPMVGGASEQRADPGGERRAADSGWDVAPYRTLVLLHCDNAARWPATRQAALCDALQQRLGANIGGFWQTQIMPAPAELGWSRAEDLKSVTSDKLLALPAAQQPPQLDKIFLIGVAAGDSVAGPETVHVRELDVRTQMWGPRFSSSLIATADAAVELAGAVWGAFRPLARIDAIKDRDVSLTYRGGALPLADHRLEAERTGTTLVPVIRHFTAEGRTVKDGVFTVPWTLLVGPKADGATASCRLWSGVDAPLAIKLDGRTEYLALAATAVSQSPTRLVVKSRQTDKPLSDVEVLAAPLPGDGKYHSIGRTDASGAFNLDLPRAYLCYVCLRVGDEPLARFPLVPGLEEQVTATIEDVGRRSDTGAMVERLRAELIDLVAQEAALKSQFARQFAAGKTPQARATLAALKALSTGDEFVRSVESRRAQCKSIETDKLAANWLDAQLKEISTLAKRMLIDETVRARSL